jgi:hypothetical protein
MTSPTVGHRLGWWRAGQEPTGQEPTGHELTGPGMNPRSRA